MTTFNFVRLTGTDNPVNGLPLTNNSYSIPIVRDVDGDGDFDMFVGGRNSSTSGFIDFFRNDGTPTAPNFVATTTDNPFNGVNVGARSALDLVDLDNDGDLDAITGGGSSVEYFRNDTTNPTSLVFTQLTGSNNPFSVVTSGFPSSGGEFAPRLGDFDNDGDFDLVLGGFSGSNVDYYENTGSANSPSFTRRQNTANPFDSFDPNGNRALIVPQDIDEDGDLDVFLSAFNPDIVFFRNDEIDNGDGTTTPNFVQDNANNVLSGPSASLGSNQGQSSTFVDLDDDGDLDVFIGTRFGGISYFENNQLPTGSPTASLSSPEDLDVILVQGALLAGFSDPDDSVLTAVNLTASEGTITDNGNGTFTFSPNQDFNGPVTLNYDVQDSLGASVPASLILNVTPINDPPVANDDTATTDEDTAITTSSVFTNDTDVENDPLTIASINTTGTLGIVTNNGNGTFTYDPNGQFENLTVGTSATDSFTYTIVDSNGATDTATVTVTINGAFDNTPPQITFSGTRSQPASFELSSLDGVKGFTFAGGGGLGRSVSNAGDVNGDGFDDVIIGAESAAPNGSNSGQSYVIFGNSSGFSANLGPSDLDGTNGFALNGIAAGDRSGSVVSSAGDVNGDGLDDLILTARTADPAGSAYGQSYVVFSNSSGFGGSFELSSLNGTNGFAIDGIQGSGVSSVSSAGDVNNDGFDDIIIGASGGVVNGMIRGQSYVVFGNSSGFNANLDLTSLNGTNGFALNGIAMDDSAGRSVSSAGDVNGDGFDDVIIGASGADPNGSNSGQSYVVFGNSSGFSASLALSSLNGTNGFALNGIGADNTSGRSVSGAGDINGDGFDDLIIGAPGASPNGTSSGQSYVVFGSNGGFSASLDLSSLNGTNGFALNGVAAFDRSGLAVSRAGDVNDDGFDDLIIGAFDADPNGSRSGQSYVVFGNNSGFNASLNLNSLDGTNGFTLNGVAANNASGTSVSTAGDVNGDGFDDLIIGGNGQSHVVLNTTLTTAPVLENTVAVATITASDIDNETLSFAISGGDDSSLFAIDATTGALTLTTAPDFENPGDADGDNVYLVEVEVTDTNGGSDTQLLAVEVIDEAAPTAVDDAVTTDEETSLSGDVFANNGNGADSEPNNAPFTVTAVNGVAAAVGTEISLGSGALLTLNSGGTFDYDPNGQFEALAVNETATDSFTYTIDNGNGETDMATVTVTINGVNDALSAADDTATTDEDTAFTTGNVFTNDSDIDTSDTLTVTNIDTTGTTGLVTDNGNGTFAYDPNGAFEALGDGDTATDSFIYTVSDGNGSTATATVTVTINGVNDAPLAADDTATTDEDTAFTTGNLLTNDSDPEGNPLTVASIDTSGTSGTVINNGDGTFTYDPNSQFESLNNGDTATDSFTYTLSDGNGGTDTATVTITIDGADENVAPIAVDDSVTTDEDTAIVSGDVFANNGSGADSDPDGDTFTVTAVNGTAADVGNQITLASGALLTLNSNGTFDYDPNGQFEALNTNDIATDTFTYTINDGNGETDTATVTVTITGIDDTPPTVTNLTPADEGTTVSFNDNLEIVFNEDVQAGNGTITIKQLSDDSVVETIDVNSAAVTIAGNIVTIDPPNNLTPATDFYVEIATGAIADVAGNDFAGILDNTTWNFTTPPDTTAPVVVTQPFTLALDANGQGMVLPSDIDNGTTDDAAIASLSVSPNTFDINDVGTPQVVALIAVDTSGNSAASTATITVVDTIAPAVITQDIAVDLDGNGQATITAGQIDNGSTDAAGIAAISVSPATFDGTNLGANTVTLTVIDTNGNVSIATAIVTVNDPIAPEITLPADLTIDSIDSTDPSNTGAATATDNADSNVDLTFSDTVLPDGTIERTWTATDDAGNTDTGVQTIAVNQAEFTLIIDADSIGEDGGTTTATVIRNTSTETAQTVNLSSDDPSEASVPATVEIPIGASFVTFNVDAVDDAIADGIQTPTITASFAGFTDSSDTVDVVDNETQGSIFIEAEDIANVTGYRLEGRNSASGDELLSLAGNGGPEIGTASFTFSGVTGFYDIVIGSYDESDGTATLTVSQDGTPVGTPIVLDQNINGKRGALAATYVTRSAGNSVELFNGATITVTGVEEGNESARFDFIEFIPAPPGENTAPVANEDTATTDEDNTVTGNVISNDTDIDGDALTVTEVDGVAVDGSPIILASGAILTMASDGTFTYDPNDVFANLNTGESATDFFDYILSDGNGGFSEASVDIAIDGLDELMLSITINDPSISENSGTTTATVSRNTGTVGNLTVALSSDDISAATVPATVVIADGTDAATFQIDAVDDAIVDGTQTATITATAAGLLDGVDTVDVTDDDVPTLTLSVDTTTIAENGGTATATVSRNTDTTNALTVDLASSDMTAATVDATVVIAAGADSATFTITGVDDAVADGTQTTTITATAATFSDDTLGIDVTDDEAPALSLSFDAVSVAENGGTATGTVTRNSGTTGNLLVALSSDDLGEAIVPATVTIPDGSDSVTFTVTGVGDGLVDGTQTPSISAAATGFNGATDSIDVLDVDVPTLSLVIDGDSISENGGTTTATVELNYVSAGPTVVTLSSDDLGEATVPATVTIDDGQTSATFTITGVDDSDIDDTQTVTITAAGLGLASVTDTVDVTDDDSNSEFFFTLNNEQTLGALAVTRRDIVAFDGTDFSLAFQGADVGLLAANLFIDGFDIISDTEILMSFNNPVTLAGLGAVDDSDVVKFTATSLGDNTAGSFSMYFDASDVGLANGGEDVNAVTLLDDGRLLISASGNFNPGGGIVGRDQDIVAFTPTSTGDTTAGTFALYVDGEDIGIGTAITPDPENIDAFSIDANGDFFFSTTGAVALTGLAGEDEDVFSVTGVTTGANTTGTVVTPLFFDGDAFGLAASDISGIDLTGGLQIPDGLSVSLDMPSISENGGAATGTVTRTGDTSAAVTVSLSSSDASEATVPATVTIGAGQSAATFAVTAVDDADTDGDQTVTVTAAAAGLTSGSAVVDVIDDDVPVVLSLSLDETSISENGGTATGTVTRTGDISAAVTVSLSSSDTSEATVPATVTIGAGQSAATFAVTAVDDADTDGDQTVTVTAAATGATSGAATLDITDDEVVSTGLLLSVNNDQSLGGVAVNNVDIVHFDGAAFSLYFDGSDLGIGGNIALNAFDVISDTEILMSFNGPVTLAGVGAVDDSDVVKFTATSLGETTAGSFSMVFDGDLFNFTQGGEDIDGVTGLTNGDLLLSTTGNLNLNDGNGVIGRDEDVVRYEAATGVVSVVIDGSDVGLDGAGGVNGVSLLANDEFFFSTPGAFAAQGTGAEDVIAFNATTTGANTVGTFDAVPFFDGDALGLGGNDVTGIDLTFNPNI